MNDNLINIERSTKSTITNGRLHGDTIMLMKPPFFTPWTPPLGIAILKAHLQAHNFKVTCVDYNTDPELWKTHHEYFTALQGAESVLMNDGYSRLWWILNAHLLAYANGADRAKITMVLEKIIPLFGIKHNKDILEALHCTVETYFRRLARYTDQYDFSSFSYVGTSTYTTSLASSLFILKYIKEQNPRIKCIMGGGVFADDLALGSDNLQTLIDKYSFVDHLILGEGEQQLLALVQGDLAHKRVISIRDLGNATMNMKDVPSPDFSDFDMDQYFHLTIEGARSCPFQCHFCSETIQWGEYRKKPMDQFANQVISLAKKYNNNAFFFGDSLMNPYIVSFARELIKQNGQVYYDGYLRADKPVARRDWVQEWARSGLYRVRLGIESAARNVLEAMDKKTTPEVISDALRTLAGEGIRTTTYWIAGFPNETVDDFNETMEFIREHHRDIYELEAHPYYYYPYGQVGSRLHSCFSLYPEEVTDTIRFKVWEIENVNPSREERYRRVSQMSELASSLGIPNIYTMAERYAAEDRWHRYHPSAIDVF
jgi:radical SAM superfamily enzyme YgiQ (UPF0313 family)